MSFAENFNKLLQDRGVTRYRVGKDLNLARQTVYNWSSGKNIPDTKSAMKLAGSWPNTSAPPSNP